MKTIYLAGPIHGRTDAECKQWRSIARTTLHLAGHEVVDPLDRDYRGTEEEHADELVADDKEAIEQADVLLVNASEPSWGTAMECLYAMAFGKTVIAWTSSPSISPWLRCHTTAIFGTLGEALEGIATGSTKGMR